MIKPKPGAKDSEEAPPDFNIKEWDHLIERYGEKTPE